MSDEFHRPTYTSTRQLPNGDIVPTNDDGQYNPTQVRLYGIRAQPGALLANAATSLAVYQNRIKVEIAFDKLPAWGVNDDVWISQLAEQIEIARAFLVKFKESRDYTALETFEFAGLPWPIKFDKEHLITFDSQKLGSVSLFATPTAPSADGTGKEVVSSGVIFGYAFEGHTYDFPKPKIMLLPTQPLTRIPKDDSGYDAKESEGYAAWVVDKLDQCVEIEIDQGFIEQLVLEANLPGKRSPSAYRAVMALAHRG